MREGGFYPQALEKGLCSERALTLTLAEMYVQGVSTRKVAAITEQLCGTAISSSLEAWRNRLLGEIVYLLLDARCEKVRLDSQIRDVAVLIATNGRRQVLGVSVSMSEQEVHGRSIPCPVGPKVCQERFETGRLDGNEHPGRADRV